MLREQRSKQQMYVAHGKGPVQADVILVQPELALSVTMTPFSDHGLSYSVMVSFYDPSLGDHSMLLGKLKTPTKKITVASDHVLFQSCGLRTQTTPGIWLIPRETETVGRGGGPALPARHPSSGSRHSCFLTSTDIQYLGLHFPTSRNELPPGGHISNLPEVPSHMVLLTADLSYMFVPAWGAMELMVLRGRFPHDGERDP